MKYLLCFALVCAVAIAKPMDEANKSEQISTTLSTKNETVISNHRVERNDKISPTVQVSSESNDNNESKTDEIKSADHKQRLSYDSTINQVNPSVYSSPLTSIHNTDSSYPISSENEQYKSVDSSYPSERSFCPLELPGLASSSYQSMSYGLRPGSYGYAGSNGLSGSYGYAGSNGLSGSYGYAGSNGLSGSYYGLSGSYGSLEPSGSNFVVPTSYSSPIPSHGGIAQQIIHKPVVTELQEVIHKPIITEVQEIVSKPVISEFQQVIHKPLFIEHIGLGPSYHGYQKHTVNQPIYHKPTKHFVRQPVYHAATIHLADEYEQHVSNGHGISELETGSSYGFTGSSFPFTYGPGINVAQPCGQYKSVDSRQSVAPYEPVYSSGLSTSDSSSYASSRASTPYRYPSISSAPDLYRYAAPGSVGYSTPTSSFTYSSLPSNNELGSTNRGTPYEQQISTFNTGNNGPFRSIKGSSQPKAAEQIIYDKFLPYTQQLNGNQQYYDNLQSQLQFSGVQQQMERSNEDPKQIKMDVDAIAKQIEKNPEMRKQLIKIITESIYVGDQIPQSNKKQQDTKMQSLPLT